MVVVGLGMSAEYDLDRAIDQRWMEDTPEEEAAWWFLLKTLKTNITCK